MFWQILAYGDFLAAEVGFQLKQILQVEGQMEKLRLEEEGKPEN